MIVFAIAAGQPSATCANDTWRPVVIDGVVARWTNTGSGPVELSYAIARSEVSDSAAVNCRRLAPPETLQERSAISPESFHAAIRTSFGRWSAVANLSFVETTNERQADILIGEQIEGVGQAFTNLDLGPVNGETRAILRAKICLNPAQRWKSGFDGDLTSFDLAYTLTHEIGHALGLDHPSARGHLMSFRYDETRSGLSTGDIDGARAIFGLPREKQDRGAAAAAQHGAFDPVAIERTREQNSGPRS